MVYGFEPVAERLWRLHVIYEAYARLCLWWLCGHSRCHCGFSDMVVGWCLVLGVWLLVCFVGGKVRLLRGFSRQHVTRLFGDK